MKHKLYIMIGVPGSGKSFFIKNNMIPIIDTSFAVISRDEIRFSLVTEDEPYFSKEGEVYKIFIQKIKESLKENEITIADATHLNYYSRTKLMRALGKSLQCAEINAVMISVPLQTAIKQDHRRINTRSFVSEGIIRRMFYQLERPSLKEGFDNIVVYEKEKDKVTYFIDTDTGELERVIK